MVPCSVIRRHGRRGALARGRAVVSPAAARSAKPRSDLRLARARVRRLARSGRGRSRSMFGFGTIVTKVFGTKFDRQMKKLRPTIERINAFEDPLKALTDDQLRSKTAEFK